MEREGIHRVRFRLANGVYRYYYYAFRGGPKFWTCDAAPVSETSPPRDFSAAFDRAMESHKIRLAAPAETVDGLIDRFISSSHFTSIDPETQSFYAESFPDIRREFGPDEIEIFLDKKTRKQIKEWRDIWREKARTADKRVGALVKILNYAVDDGDIEFHVAGNINKLYKADRAEIIWEVDEINRLLSACNSRALKSSIEFAAHTGIRRNDLVTVPASADKGNAIEFYTSKSNGRQFVSIPVTKALRQILTGLQEYRSQFPVQPMTMVFNSSGRPWSADGFSSSFRKAKKRCNVDKRLHDIRGTACTNFIKAGLTDEEVALIMGWKEDTVKHLKRVYVSDRALADGVLAKIERTQKEQKL